MASSWRSFILLHFLFSVPIVSSTRLQFNDQSPNQDSNEILVVDDDVSEDDSEHELGTVAVEAVNLSSFDTPMEYMSWRFKDLCVKYERKYNKRGGRFLRGFRRTMTNFTNKGRDTLVTLSGHMLSNVLRKGTHVRTRDLMPDQFEEGLYNLNTFQPYVWTFPIHTEIEFSNLVRLTYMTAKKFALVTTYGCNPGGKAFDMQSTSAALWESVLNRLGDDVTLVFAYNKDVLRQRPVRKTTVKVEDDDESGWQHTIIEPLMRHGVKPHLDLGKVRAKVYFVEMAPIGLLGSWHTKFYINDQHLYGTGGWSVGNQAKMDWIDAGVITSDPLLAKQEMEFFIKHMLIRPENRVGRVTYHDPLRKKVRWQNLHDVASVPPESKETGIGFEAVDLGSGEMYTLLETLRSSASSFDDSSLRDSVPNVLSQSSLLAAGFRGDHVKKHRVVRKTAIPVRNLGSSVALPENTKKCNNLGEMKPINLAIWLLIEQAQEGDTVWIRNKALMSNMPKRGVGSGGIHVFGSHSRVWSWLRMAARKKVKVKFLFIEEKLQEDEHDKLYYMSNTMARALFAGNIYWTQEEQEIVKNLLEIRKIQYDPLEAAGVPINCDHGKVYALEKLSGKLLVGVGTWNADAQSLLGSNENMLFFDEDSAADDVGDDVFRGLLKTVWDRSLPMNLVFN